jgi:6-phosphogluconolactonase
LNTAKLSGEVTRTVRHEVIIDEPSALASIFTERVSTALRNTERFALVLPGGSVAETFFPVLAAAAATWKRVHFFWGDERGVPPSDPDSNYRLASTLLLRRIDSDPHRVHRIKGEMADLGSAAADYEAELEAALGEPPRFDMVLLGMGPDGHVCSLFPGHRALDETVRRVTAIDDAPKPPARRVTLTLPALEGADVVVAAFGASKASAIRDALENPSSRLPVALAARRAQRTVFMLDRNAAARLAMHV